MVLVVCCILLRSDPAQVLHPIVALPSIDVIHKRLVLWVSNQLLGDDCVHVLPRAEDAIPTAIDAALGPLAPLPVQHPAVRKRHQRPLRVFHPSRRARPPVLKIAWLRHR